MTCTAYTSACVIYLLYNHADTLVHLIIHACVSVHGQHWWIYHYHEAATKLCNTAER